MLLFKIETRGSRVAQALRKMNNKKGMEMVQVAILVAIAVALGLIFKNQITSFVNKTFSSLNNSSF